jgi:hypothetical protein
MVDKQIFFDPQRKRWKRLRRILDIAAIVTTLVVAGVIFNTPAASRCPSYFASLHNLQALHDRTRC